MLLLPRPTFLAQFLSLMLHNMFKSNNSPLIEASAYRRFLAERPNLLTLPPILKSSFNIKHKNDAWIQNCFHKDGKTWDRLCLNGNKLRLARCIHIIRITANLFSFNRTLTSRFKGNHPKPFNQIDQRDPKPFSQSFIQQFNVYLKNLQASSMYNPFILSKPFL